MYNRLCVCIPLSENELYSLAAGEAGNWLISACRLPDLPLTLEFLFFFYLIQQAWKSTALYDTTPYTEYVVLDRHLQGTMLPFQGFTIKYSHSYNVYFVLYGFCFFEGIVRLLRKTLE